MVLLLPTVTVTTDGAAVGAVTTGAEIVTVLTTVDAEEPSPTVIVTADVIGVDVG